MQRVIAADDADRGAGNICLPELRFDKRVDAIEIGFSKLSVGDALNTQQNYEYADRSPMSACQPFHRESPSSLPTRPR
jgi:hypothetical protein